MAGSTVRASRKSAADREVTTALFAGEGSMWRGVYLAVGVLVARWVFRRKLEGDPLSRLRSIGGI